MGHSFSRLPTVELLLDAAAADSSLVESGFIEVSLSDLKADVDNLSSFQFRRLAERSISLPTHRKWLLGERTMERIRIWIHSYTPQANSVHTYAASLHNHRYPFVSRVLRGSFSRTDFRSRPTRRI